MKYFFIAVSETEWLEDVFSVVKEWDDRLSRLRGVRVGVLIRFSKWRRVCLPCKLADAYGVPLFVDNGAFEYFSKTRLESRTLDKAAIEKWISEYASWLSTWYTYVTAAAMPDLPVHGRHFLPADARLERIVLTARLHREFARRLRVVEPQALSKMVVVIQGFEVGEYKLSLELNSAPELCETCSLGGGCPYEGVVGVGSVCVRKPSAGGKTGVLASGAAAGTLASFMREFLSERWPRWIRGFHFFGLHTEAVRRFCDNPLYFASDTGAHGLNYRFKWRTVLGCKKLDRECYMRAVDRQLKTTLGALLSKPLV